MMGRSVSNTVLWCCELQAEGTQMLGWMDASMEGADLLAQTPLPPGGSGAFHWTSLLYRFVVHSLWTGLRCSSPADEVTGILTSGPVSLCTHQGWLASWHLHC